MVLIIIEVLYPMAYGCVLQCGLWMYNLWAMDVSLETKETRLKCGDETNIRRLMLHMFDAA